MDMTPAEAWSRYMGSRFMAYVPDHSTATVHFLMAPTSDGSWRFTVKGEMVEVGCGRCPGRLMTKVEARKKYAKLLGLGWTKW
jgi:hypothetical protein